MRKNLFTIAYAALLLFACKDAAQQSDQQVEIPEALEDKSSGFGFSKRGEGNDLVTELYNELVEKTPELKALEQQISDLKKQQPDSTESVNSYVDKNNTYYDAANILLRNMHDSLLREKIKLQINFSRKAYNEKVADHESLLQLINEKSLQLHDLHTVLMLVRTLPVIEKYQQTNLTDTVPISNILTKYIAAVQQIDTLTKR